MTFALDHMFNIALEEGAFVTVRRDLSMVPPRRIPLLVFGCVRDDIIEVGL
jgi:hypothetical protein